MNHFVYFIFSIVFFESFLVNGQTTSTTTTTSNRLIGRLRKKFKILFKQIKNLSIFFELQQQKILNQDSFHFKPRSKSFMRTTRPSIIISAFTQPFFSSSTTTFQPSLFTATKSGSIAASILRRFSILAHVKFSVNNKVNEFIYNSSVNFQKK